MKTCIYVDGRITPPEEAVIPVLDHGFLLGDSVYEVFWWHRGVLVQEREHMERLAESGRRLYMDLQHPADDLVRAIQETMEAAEVGADEDAYVRLIVTRGAGPLGLDIRRVEKRSVVVVVAPAGRPDETVWEKGLTVAIVERQRNPRMALDPGAKTGNYLNNVLALYEAKLAGADDAFMLNERGEVTEATTANVFLVVGGILVTPPLEAGILKGTTRTRILDLSRAHGVRAEQRRVGREDLEAADEVLVSSSVKGIIPVVRIDGKTVGDGRPGPVTRRLRALFEAAADAEAAAGRAARAVRP
jgi:branched-chain amino acid aminotransferase